MKMMTPAMKIFFILTLTLHFSTAADYKLNMAENSIDDDFRDLDHKFVLQHVLKLLEEEMPHTEGLKEAWEKFKGITDHRIRALTIYTDKKNKIYYKLNSAMRDGKKNYASFGFKALHYLITRGIQMINSKRECRDVYRRSEDHFTIEGDTVRAGSFWSSSISMDLKQYGEETCLKIHTCYGANITYLSVDKKEEEVLIPPYEVFEIIKEKDIMGCKLFYSLKSAGIKSNMKREIWNYLAMAKLRK